METVDILSSFRDAIRSNLSGVQVTEFAPLDYPSITAFHSLRNNVSADVFTFHVPSNLIVAAVRLSGTSVISSHTWRSSNLIQPGSTYLLAPGTYSVIFGRRSSETLFVVADRSTIPAIDPFLLSHRGHIPHTTIDLISDPIIEKIGSISTLSQSVPYFRFSSLLMDMLDRLTEQVDHKKTLYGLPHLDEAFDRICSEVISHPARAWTIAEAANASGYSVYHFSRTFRAKTGHGFPEFVNRVRSTQALLLMCEYGMCVEEAFEQVGINAKSSAKRALVREFGLNQIDIRRILSLSPAKKAG